MNLYDEMNKKKPLVVEPEVAEAPVLEPVEPVAVEEVVVEPVKAETPVKEYKYTSWWKSPEYEKQVAELANVAEKRRETDKKQAKWNRNAAIFSDIARLGAQVGANAGGAYMIDRTTPFTDKATEKLERLRKEHAAEIEGYAQKLKEAKLKDREDLMNRNIAEMKYKQADDELKYKIAKDEELRKRWNAEQAVREENAETNRIRANKSGGSSGKTSNFISLYMPDGKAMTFSKDKNGDNYFENAWQTALDNGMKPLMKQQVVKGDYGEIKEVKEVPETNLAARRAYLEDWSYENEKRGDAIVWDEDNPATVNVDKDFE